MKHDWQQYFSEKPCSKEWTWMCSRLDAGDTLEQIAQTAVVSSRTWVAEYGNDDLRALLVNDDDASVRWAVAEYGNDDLRALLVNDADANVRC